MFDGSFTLALISLAATAQVVIYEGGSFPEQVGWVRSDRPFLPDRWLDEGSFCQYSEYLLSEDDFYTRSLAEFVGAPTWFLEWRVVTDGFPVFNAVAPCVVAASSTTGIWYHATVGDTQIEFFPDITVPFVYANIEPGVPHTYRLELHPGTYAFWIDGVPIDSGKPEGVFPAGNSVIGFGARAAGEDSTTCWSYLRYGLIPEDASGDFDSDGRVGPSDVSYFLECLQGPDIPSGPGCRWADLDGDADTDLLDLAAFQSLFAQPGPDIGAQRLAP